MHEYEDIICTLKALSDETRLGILTLLAKKEYSACQLLCHFQITQPTLSYHLKILTDCGLLMGAKQGCSVFYSINQEKLKTLQKFIGKLAR